MGAARAVAAGLVCALAAAGAILFCGVRLEARRAAPAGGGLLYLPSGRLLAVASLGYRHLLADVIYLWSIQYYSHYEIAERYDYLEKIYREVITELDPRYIDPYWIGALIMTVEAGDLEMALRLLDKGIAANPDQWILPYIAGWECYHARQYDRAAGYFDKAMTVPGAPAVIRRAYAGMFQKKGDIPAALAAWSAIAGDPAMDERGREIALRRVRDLTIERDRRIVQAAAAAFLERRGRLPESLAEMVREGLLDRAPEDPDGLPYRYDRSTGSIRPPPERVLQGR